MYFETDPDQSTKWPKDSRYGMRIKLDQERSYHKVLERAYFCLNPMPKKLTELVSGRGVHINNEVFQM